MGSKNKNLCIKKTVKYLYFSLKSPDYFYKPWRVFLVFGLRKYQSDPHVFGTIGKVLKSTFRCYEYYFSIMNICQVMVFQRFRNFSERPLLRVILTPGRSQMMRQIRGVWSHPLINTSVFVTYGKYLFVPPAFDQCWSVNCLWCVCQIFNEMWLRSDFQMSCES